MAESDKVFAGSIPEVYDRILVPLIFEPYAREMAARLARVAPRDVLETAAGTGVLTRAIAALVPGANIVATDLNQPMLDVAAARQPRITWRTADASALPFEDQTFDAVACQFGAMFFPDKVLAYREAGRVLKPGGHFLVSVWDRIEENAFPDVVTIALRDVFPEDPPGFMARIPHGYHDVAVIRELRGGWFFIRAGGDCHSHQQGRVGARCRGRVLSGHPAAERNRGARRGAAGRSNATCHRGACFEIR